MRVLVTALCLLGLFSVGWAQQAPEASHVRIQTSLGDIDVELARTAAPLTTANFLHYATTGRYDRTIFHRVVPGVLVQGGGYSTSLIRRATQDPVPSESENGLKNLRGSIAMARYDDPDSATNQFFINLVDNPSLDRSGDEYKKDAGYTVFGRVVSGMEVADAIGALETGERRNRAGELVFEAEAPLEDVIILRVDPIDADKVGE